MFLSIYVLLETYAIGKLTTHKYYTYAYLHIHTWYILQPQFIWPYKKPMVHFRLINVIVFCHVYFDQMLYINGIHYSCSDPATQLCTRDFSYFQKSPRPNNVWNRQNRKFASPIFTANMFAYFDVAYTVRARRIHIIHRIHKNIYAAKKLQRLFLIRCKPPFYYCK